MPRTYRRKRKFSAATVKYVRTGLRLNQSQFAHLMGVCRRTIIRWEQGTHYPRSWTTHNRRFYAVWDKYEEWLTYVHGTDGREL